MAESPLQWPPFAPVPSLNIRRTLPPPEWGACIDSWIILAQYRLLKWEDSHPKLTYDAADTSLLSFLASYYEEMFLASSSDVLKVGSKTPDLRKICFTLTHRLLSQENPPPSLLEWAFLANLSATYGQSAALKNLLEELWSRKSDAMSQSLEKAKMLLVKDLSSNKTFSIEDVAHQLNQLTCLALVLPEAGHVLMTGSDYLDSLYTAYKAENEPLRKGLVANAYMGLTSLMKTPEPKISLLLDHIFSLKSSTDLELKANTANDTLLSDLIANTSFLTHLTTSVQTSNQARGAKLIDSLHDLKSRTIPSTRPHVRRKPRQDKGKSRAPDIQDQDITAHNLSLITQIQDLFPELGAGYISQLLTFYSNSVETVTAHLLDSTLDPSLHSLDTTTPLSTSASHPSHHINLSPRATPPLNPLPDRKNIFDADDLTTHASNLHIGRANADRTADALLSAPKSTSAKAAILSALAAFDSDDDERDDTYDVADVGGTVDSTIQDTEADLRNQNHQNRAVPTRDGGDETPDPTESALFAAYKSTPALFARDATTRRSKARTDLRTQLSNSSTTPVTDETIEGFALMLSRDPRRLRRLETRYSTSTTGVQQSLLAATSYRKPGDTETEESDTGGEGSAAGGFNRGRGGRIRGGRGRGGGGRGGGDAAGPSGERDTERARQRKERGGNKTRREGRARKMARAGFPG
jgi:activating signal cointegrator complex subunit 2